MQWVNAFKVAIENAEEPVRYQRSLLDKRKLARQEEKEREEEEDIRKASHADSLDQTKIQLEQEKQVLMHVVNSQLRLLLFVWRIFFLGLI